MNFFSKDTGWLKIMAIVLFLVSNISCSSKTNQADGSDASTNEDAAQDNGGQSDGQDASSTDNDAPSDSGQDEPAPGDQWQPDGGPVDDSTPDGETPTLCQDKCPFDIEPRRTVLGLPEPADLDASMPLWAVLDDGSSTCPRYLTSQATWISLDPDIVTVDSEGQLMPLKRGTTYVRASYEGYTAYAEVIVAGTLKAGYLTYQGRRRSYLLYVPECYDGAEPLPLVLGLHGGGGTAKKHLIMSQLDRSAHHHCFFAAYPNGTGAVRSFNGGNCCGYAVEHHVDDVGFVRQMVEHVASSHALDRKRVYTSGLSNGAIMSHRLACEASDIIAAAAPIAGGLNVGGDFSACSPPRPVPIIMFHGTTDANYPIGGGVGIGGSGVDFYPITHPEKPNTLNDWITINGAASEGTVTYQKGNATCKTYDGPAPVVMCIIEPAKPLSQGQIVCDGGGHAYPGGACVGYAGEDRPSQDLDANEVMWEFFSAHPLP